MLKESRDARGHETVSRWNDGSWKSLDKTPVTLEVVEAVEGVERCGWCDGVELALSGAGEPSGSTRSRRSHPELQISKSRVSDGTDELPPPPGLTSKKDPDTVLKDKEVVSASTFVR